MKKGEEREEDNQSKMDGFNSSDNGFIVGRLEGEARDRSS